jgi:UDP-2,3-diacylglucosamine hydrolase
MHTFRRLWIFSDLHLTQLDSELGSAFLRILSEPQTHEDAVVFAGDIFEILVGDSAYFKEKYQQFIDSVEGLLSKGVAVYYIEGNHDFHLSRLFPAGVVFADDAISLTLKPGDGSLKQIKIEHGDLVDHEDLGYLRLRFLFRSMPVRALAHVIPGRWIETLASGIAREATRKAKELPENWDADSRDRLRKVFRSSAEAQHRLGFDFVVYGHCHDLDEFGGFYWNMGFPPVHRQFLVYDSASAAGKDSLLRRNFL